jgi:peptide/nickel transport system substrate-binding protein
MQIYRLTSRSYLRWAIAIGALVLIASTLGAPAVASAKSVPRSGGVATFAEAPGSPPNYIFPLYSGAYCTTTNIGQFIPLMYRPLYWFGKNESVVLNSSLSLARAPVYSDNDTKVTINLKAYKWSDGESLTAEDVTFWENMVEAEKANWCNYVPGLYPDNVTKVTVDSPEQLTFTMNGSYSPGWFTGNELSQITPLPLSWDRTSATTTSNCASDEADCVAVYKYLSAQAAHPQTYATNKLWRVVDGPWELTQFNTLGYATFVPNPSYSGPVKPRLAEFKEIPFTSAASEDGTIRSGSSDIQVGYIPQGDLKSKPAGKSVGPNPLSAKYNLAPWPNWGFGYIPLDYRSATMGVVYHQLYARQALESLLDQPLIIKTQLAGYGFVQSGPIPTDVKSPYITKADTKVLYPFSVGHARSLLKTHGWAVNGSGQLACVRPGDDPTECGAGVTRGHLFTVNLTYASGITYLANSMEAYKSAASEVGITINLSEAPSGTVINDLFVCATTAATCSWDALDWGLIGWSYLPDFYPTGEEFYKTGSVEDVSGYSNAEMDRLIEASDTSASPAALQAYESYVRAQLPVLWQEVPALQISEVAKDLHGVTPQNPTGAITPEDWYYTK